LSERKAVAVTGPSGSGKTTLIEKLVYAFVDDKRVAVIKHDPKDKAVFDKEGKDSDRFFKAGAETVVVSPTRTTFFSHDTRSLDMIVSMLGDFDLLMVEGLKTWPLPRIGVFRGALDESYLPVCDAIAVDHTVDLSAYEIPAHVDILDLNDTAAIAAWIESHAAPLFETEYENKGY
jgi:molybdopterin-guanine dinucleotide biosynthesis protein B